jgi:hypothetical protein
MVSRLREVSLLAWLALAARAVGYVLTFCVRPHVWPWVGLLLMIAALLLGLAAIVWSPRRTNTVVALLAAIPFAIVVWAFWTWRRRDPAAHQVQPPACPLALGADERVG